MTDTLRVARAALAEEARRPVSGADFAEHVMTAVRRAVPFDGYCLLGLDPCSGMRSFLFSRNGLDGMAERLAHNETVELDVHRYSDLARAAVPVGVLSAGTSAGAASPRMNEILRPAGFSSELRLALASQGRLWGALVMFRCDRRTPFTDEEAARALALTDPLRAVVRRYPVRSTTGASDPLPPGVVLLDSNNSIVSMTLEARAWLDDVRAGGQDEIDAADVLRVVYDVALATQAATAESASPVCRVRTTSGRWLLVHGSRVDGSPADVAVVLQQAAVRQVLPAASAWFGLTQREGEILQLVALGLQAKHMGRQLQLSVLTVNDHLGAIYRKAGVSGREQLLARLG